VPVAAVIFAPISARTSSYVSMTDCQRSTVAGSASIAIAPAGSFTNLKAGYSSSTLTKIAGSVAIRESEILSLLLANYVSRWLRRLASHIHPAFLGER
jgi:hypothetical protein